MANELEDFITGFELAQRRDGRAILADFLPPPSHPLYRHVLGELIRIDLEYGWQRGRPKRLQDYQQQFPDLADDREIWVQIGFEEYRLRRQAGEQASPEEYRQRFGSIVDSWPDLPSLRASRFSPSLDTRVLSMQSVEKAAHWLAGYQNGKIGTPWCASNPGNAEQADPHPYPPPLVGGGKGGGQRRDPTAADSLAQALLTMPEVGSNFLNFRLVADLGRGAFGRVFLAQQSDLAGRYVALKIATDLFTESQTLAQLQHTNIVPIYSAHRADPFQALCMPYLGSTTLADVLRSFDRLPSLPVSGKALVSTLNQRRFSTLAPNEEPSSNGRCRLPSGAPGKVPSGRRDLPSDLGSSSPATYATGKPGEQLALKRIEELTYVEAILWIGARLADGLAHAHEHRIIHRDLKPANVLLADDGQPRLLDFNLSDNQTLRSSALGASVGGTLPYMAPEHLESLRDRHQCADARSDIYSLGLILFELLTGKPAFPPDGIFPPLQGGIKRSALSDVLPVMIAQRKKSSPSVRQWSQGVSPAAESIIRHCLEPDPANRYQSARHLQEDLERQLENRPLRFAPEPSLRERTQKWARRHPRLTSSTSVALLALVLLSTLTVALVMRGNRLARFQALDHMSLFEEDMRDAQFLLYGRTADREQLDRGIDQCRKTLDRYQVLDNPDWRQLPQFRNLPAAEREQLHGEIGETLYLAARATYLRAVYRPDQPRLDEVASALSLSQAAEGCYDADYVPRAVWQQQAELFERQGNSDEASALSDRAKKTPLRSARDCYLAGHFHAVRGEFREALAYLEEAVQRDPKDFSAWFVKGNCHHSLLHYDEAIACYSTCIALRPKFHWAWYDRGLVRLGSGRAANDLKGAVMDFDQMLALQPDLAEAYLNRALADEGLGRYNEAIQDLTKALELGSPCTEVYFLRAAVREKAHDLKGAQCDREEGMRRQPADEQSWVARGLARLPGDPKGALADFDRALALNPRSFAALQNKAHALADHLRDDREAVKVLDQEVALYPENAMARAGRGVSLARLGERKKALADAEQALLLDTRPPNLYQVGCIYALTSRQNPQDRLRAFELLAQSLKNFGLDIVDSDTDLNPIRQSPEFRRIIAAARELQK
jgi:serine/threonine protein kinase/tetratricopeptide (TPR) repeat protein